MANTGPTKIATSTRYWNIDTNATTLDLGGAAPGKAGSFAIHLYSNAATGNGITIQAQMAGASSQSLAWIGADYQEDATDVATGTKITATGRYYVRCDHNEVIRLSFEITGGSWDVVVSSGPG
jgi:hypothetical protein